LKKNLNFILNFVFTISISAMFFCSGCFLQVTDEEKVEEEKEWNILIYMAADNNLESSAISDINEMESSGFDTSKMNIFVLVDRALGNDASNGDWSDTRLLKIVNDNSAAIASTRLNCNELTLSENTSVELDMANKEVLEGFIQFVMNNFPARYNAFIVWGHGCGWRYYSTDINSQTSLSLYDLGIGLKRGLAGYRPFDLIAFDTCFSLNLETIYELKNYGSIFAGTPGLEINDGWNYNFLGKALKSDCSPLMLGQIICDSFREEYGSYEYGSFALIDLSKVKEFCEGLNMYFSEISECICNREKQNSYRTFIKSDVIGYDALSYPCDHYFDIYDFVSKVKEIEEDIDNTNIENLFSEMFLYTVCSSSMCSQYPLGLYFTTYIADGVCDVSHPLSYTALSKVSGKCSLVNDLISYVPTTEGETSFLDCLFYKNFNL